MRVARELLDQIIEHARREAPNECCGLVGARDGAATSVHPTRNAVASPLRFEIDPKDLYDAHVSIEDRGDDVAAVYHSHVRTEPYPSQTDINFAAKWPGIEWLIVGLAGEEPDVRSYVIDDGVVREVEVEVA